MTEKLMGNRWLEALPRQVRQRLIDRCEQVELIPGVMLSGPETVIRHVYFPTEGYISLTAILRSGSVLTVGMIGNEGVLGAVCSIGVDFSPTQEVVLGAGGALRMPVRVFRDELARNKVLRLAVGNYVYVLFEQCTQASVCICFHPLEARLARWLLMTQDRANADHFHVTHVHLAQMLGVRRSGVTRAAGRFQDRAFIRYRRGEVTVLDRKGLENSSCECYEMLQENQQRFGG